MNTSHLIQVLNYFKSFLILVHLIQKDIIFAAETVGEYPRKPKTRHYKVS